MNRPEHLGGCVPWSRACSSTPGPPFFVPNWYSNQILFTCPVGLPQCYWLAACASRTQTVPLKEMSWVEVAEAHASSCFFFFYLRKVCHDYLVKQPHCFLFAYYIDSGSHVKRVQLVPLSPLSTHRSLPEGAHSIRALFGCWLPTRERFFA